MWHHLNYLVECVFLWIGSTIVCAPEITVSNWTSFTVPPTVSSPWNENPDFASSSDQDSNSDCEWTLPSLPVTSSKQTFQEKPNRLALSTTVINNSIQCGPHFLTESSAERIVPQAGRIHWRKIGKKTFYFTFCYRNGAKRTFPNSSTMYVQRTCRQQRPL